MSLQTNSAHLSVIACLAASGMPADLKKLLIAGVELEALHESA